MVTVRASSMRLVRPLFSSGLLQFDEDALLTRCSQKTVTAFPLDTKQNQLFSALSQKGALRITEIDSNTKCVTIGWSLAYSAYLYQTDWLRF